MALSRLTGGGFIVLLLGARAPNIAGLTKRLFLACVLLSMLALVYGLGNAPASKQHGPCIT